MENAETLKKENAALKEQLKRNSLIQDSFEEDNDKVVFTRDYQTGHWFCAFSILLKIYCTLQREC